jgi:MFS family permease
MREGLEVVFKNPVLWHIAGCTATTNLGSNMVYGAVYLIFVYRILHLTAGQAGLIFGIGSIGFLLGALVASWMVRRLGVGPSLAINIAGGGLTILATPLAMLGSPAIVLIALSLLGSFIGAPYNITQVSLRQAITPDRVQGRMNATMRTIVWGTIPIGSFLGGVLGSQIGIVQTILLGGAISTLAALWIIVGPVIRVKEQPAAVTA